jgi:hypothetical protein
MLVLGDNLLLWAYVIIFIQSVSVFVGEWPFAIKEFWALFSAQFGNLEVLLYFLKAKQGHVLEKMEKDKWM